MSRYFDDYDGTDDLLVMDQYLEHYGRKGMKWGQHLPDILQLLMRTGRYRGKSSAQINAIRRRRKTNAANAKHKAQVAKRRQESLKKARAVAKKNAPRRKELDDIALNGDSETVLKRYNEMSPKQRQTAMDQLKMKSDIQALRQKDIEYGYQKFNSFVNAAGNVAINAGKIADAVSKGYNTYQLLQGNTDAIKNAAKQAKNNNDQQKNQKQNEDNAAKSLANVLSRAGNYVNDEKKKK